ncbi:MAG: PhoX family phosphatase [Gammaproteobacteria bacterium]|nr:PhoX family phosphatase [Gammaproteobacteria bacterium]
MKDDKISNEIENDTIHSQGGEYFGAIASRVISRRAVLKGSAAVAATLAINPAIAGGGVGRHQSENEECGTSGLSFEAIPEEMAGEEEIHVANGYGYQVLLPWGTPLHPDAPTFDVDKQSRVAQEKQVGFNHDLVLYFPLPDRIKREVAYSGSLDADADRLLAQLYPKIKQSERYRYTHRALVCINHEYTSGGDMFRDYSADAPTQNQVEVEIAAHGMTIAELFLDWDNQWRFVQDSPFNRRISGYTEMEISGPLAGYEALQTAEDPEGKRVIGMFNNCAGGKTPWGTILTCEENFDQYFANYATASEDNKFRSDRIAASDEASSRHWEDYDKRFDLAAESNQYNKYGYVVEIDPYDPSRKPVKRTALGRFKHEGAMGVETGDGRVAIYSGDDARFEYVYKFISKNRCVHGNRAGNWGLLDEGTLYVARFSEGLATAQDEPNMGYGEWLPLVWEEGNALHQAGFKNQQEVLLNTRGAADVLGATPMDRPEDVDVSPVNGRVYVALTNNSNRSGETEDAVRDAQGREVSSWWNAANPRLNNQNGHVIELIETDDDAGSLTFEWNIFILCGIPGDPHTAFGDIQDPAAAGVSTISDPDNVAIDSDGNLWIATDGMPSGVYIDGEKVIQSGERNDGVFAVPTEGPDRGLLKRFMAGVPGSEVCGPEFSNDGRTFFCALQHPRDGEAFDKPWPTGETVARPSLIAIRHQDGEKIGR